MIFLISKLAAWRVVGGQAPDFADQLRDESHIACHGLKESRVACYQKAALTGLCFQHRRKQLADGLLDLECVLDPSDLRAILRREPKTGGKRREKGCTSDLEDVFANEPPRAGRIPLVRLVIILERTTSRFDGPAGERGADR
jgi:hypothetical protein